MVWSEMILWVTDLNKSTEYKMTSLFINILFLELSLISIIVTNNGLWDVAWSRNMIWDTIQILRYGLSQLKVETRSEPKHKKYKISNNMREERDEARNKWDKKQGTKLRCKPKNKGQSWNAFPCRYYMTALSTFNLAWSL